MSLLMVGGSVYIPANMQESTGFGYPFGKKVITQRLVALFKAHLLCFTWGSNLCMEKEEGPDSSCNALHLNPK